MGQAKQGYGEHQPEALSSVSIQHGLEVDIVIGIFIITWVFEIAY